MSVEQPVPDAICCNCAECGEAFFLAAEESHKSDRTTTLEIRSCDSDGIYAIFISCPLCGHVHNLK